ncbi:MAG: M48 family metallopeptidase [Flavobacteriaceae bacterium]
MLRKLFTAPAAEPARTVMEVAAGGRTAPVILRRSARAERISLKLGQRGDAFVLTVPARAREADALRFAESQAGWMRARLSRLAPRVPFAPGAEIPLRGEPHRLVASGGLRGLVEAADGAITVPGLPEHFARKTTDFLKRQARADLVEATARYCAAIGVEPRRVALRDPQTRWGSCSTSGTISYSWRLIMAPAQVLDYLAAHEVAHIRHMNHGPKFWKLLREICPGTDGAEAWLKRHGRSLHAYGQQEAGA